MRKVSDLALTLNVTDYLSHKDYLARLYELAKAEFPSYSYQKFAEDLGFSATNVLRLVVIGARPLTSKAAVRIALSLKLHGAERRYWTSLVKYANAKTPAERTRLFKLLLTYKTRENPRELTPDQAAYFGDWFNPVVREMIALPQFDGTPEWIKQNIAFPLRLEQIKQSLELLQKLKMITFDEKSGRYLKSEQLVETTSEVDSLAVVSYHQKMIEISREAITAIDETERDIRALTMTVPNTLLPELKARIEEWVHDMARRESDLTGQSEGRVVQINVQMFPFTKKPRSAP